MKNALLTALLCFVTAGFPANVKANHDQGTIVESEKHYSFSRDVFTSRIPTWQKVLAPMRGAPGLKYLEIGVEEGRSAIWMLDNILTDQVSSMVAVDTFHLDGREAQFRANLEVCGCAHKVTIIKGRSQEKLKDLQPGYFDLIYVDGSHYAWDVMADAVLSWSLLKPGGLIIFDDYGWKKRLPAELRPQMAIDSFIAANRYEIEIVHMGYQVVLRKRTNPCGPRYLCTPFEHYAYFWREEYLYDLDAKEKVPLSIDEQTLLKKVLKARLHGRPGFRIPIELRSNGDVLRLTAKLGLDIGPLH